MAQPAGGTETTVSTHSRPKAAGPCGRRRYALNVVSTHSRPKAAGITVDPAWEGDDVSTHSRPKAAGLKEFVDFVQSCLFQHTAARRRLATGSLYRQRIRLFQHTAARRRLARLIRFGLLWAGFNTQPPEGGWPDGAGFFRHAVSFQHTAARRRLVRRLEELGIISVFQHTAARRRLAHVRAALNARRCSFNTQPPEGGWDYELQEARIAIMFQHTAARRRLALSGARPIAHAMFQHTAARRRLGAFQATTPYRLPVSTHSRPKAAGFCCLYVLYALTVFQHTAARRRLAAPSKFGVTPRVFQHTAARRRLAALIGFSNRQTFCFNTQPPEGGWQFDVQAAAAGRLFQHTAARRRLVANVMLSFPIWRFQHTAARRRLDQVINPRPAIQCFNTQPPEGGWKDLGYGDIEIIVSTHSRPKAAGRP